LRQNIRRLGVFFIILAVALVLNLSYLQVFGQKDLVENPANTRRLMREYGIARGRIITSDGQVAAESRRTDGPSDPFKYQRSYPLGSLLSHVVGYDSPQFGRSGLEQQYNEYLLGRKPFKGWVEEMTKNVEEGFDLHITIDGGVQAAAARALGERKGAVVALDPKTGALLAAYSWPTFDPNGLVSQERDAGGALKADALMQSYNQNPASPMLNRVTMGLYAPGSSFKVLTGSAGIESGFPPATTYNCPGVWPVGGSRVTNYGDPPRDFGTIDMDVALARSVNTYFAQLASDLGAENLVYYSQLFGLNGVPPLDYPAVAASFIPAPEKIDAVELAWSGAGQGRLLLTPLQLGLIGCGIANQGKIMFPHLMRDVRNEEGILGRFDIGEWRAPISAETAAEMLEMMVHVVEDGTGAEAAIPGVSVAGKTGTAEVEGKSPHTWFLGIAPAENPQVVVAVVVENSGGGGGSVAAPIARQVMEAALR
jgi:peptidoglycan glycosyltransferase